MPAASLKSLIRGLTPPLIWEAAQHLKNWIAPPPPSPPPVTEIEFEEWDQAVAAAGHYEDQTLTNFRAERFALNLAAGNLPRAEGTPLYWLAKSIHEPCSIVDFGGSFGEYGLSLLGAFPSFQYTVVETGAIVQRSPPGLVSFSTQLPDRCDIFFSSGTLQYLQDPYSIVEAAFSGATRAVVLARNLFSERDQFRVQQSRLFDNGGGAIPPGYENRQITYPIRTIRESRIAEIAARHGFSLLGRFKEQDAAPIAGIESYLQIYRKS